MEFFTLFLPTLVGISPLIVYHVTPVRNREDGGTSRIGLSSICHFWLGTSFSGDPSMAVWNDIQNITVHTYHVLHSPPSFSLETLWPINNFTFWPLLLLDQPQNLQICWIIVYLHGWIQIKFDMHCENYI